MSLRRILVPADAVADGRVLIEDKTTIHHVARVLRMKAGDRLECTDGQGGRHRGKIVAIEKTRIVVEITEQEKEAVIPGGIIVVQSLIKPDRFEWAVEKASELGADRLFPVIAQRSVIRLDDRQRELKRQRWQRIADQAAEQCGRATRLSIEPVRSLAEHASTAPRTFTLVPTLASKTVPIAEALAPIPRETPISVWIGPEGDFSAPEIECARSLGASLVSLGAMTLRAETASVAVLAILQHWRSTR